MKTLTITQKLAYNFYNKYNTGRLKIELAGFKKHGIMKEQCEVIEMIINERKQK